MKLIIGLGNPGKQYEKTRHNIGWRAADELAEKNTWKKHDKFDALISDIKIKNNKIILAKPVTFMNNSGDAARKIAEFYKIKKQDILVMHDDIDLLTGVLRLRDNGTDGGHKGIRSVISCLKTKDISRLKIGVAEKNAGKQNISSEKYILKPPGAQAEKTLKKSLERIPEIVDCWLSGEKNATFCAL